MTWVSSSEAAQILSRNAGRPISTDYVRVLARNGVIRYRQNPRDASTNQYSAEDCERHTVRGRTEKRVEVRVRDKRIGGKRGRPRKSTKTEGESHAAASTH